MRGLIELKRVKYQGKAIQLRRRNQRVYTAAYYLRRNEKKIRVCVMAFCSILGVGQKQVKLLNQRSWTNPHGAVSADGRGKHGRQPKTPAGRQFLGC